MAYHTISEYDRLKEHGSPLQRNKLSPPAGTTPPRSLAAPHHQTFSWICAGMVIENWFARKPAIMLHPLLASVARED